MGLMEGRLRVRSCTAHIPWALSRASAGPVCGGWHHTTKTCQPLAEIAVWQEDAWPLKRTKGRTLWFHCPKEKGMGDGG